MKVNIRTGFFALAIAGIGCGGKTDNAQADPSRPAVVQGPPVVLPSDTAKPDTMEQHRARLEELKQKFLPSYSMVGATSVFGDRRMLTRFYASDATLTFGDSTFTGSAEIATALVNLARTNSFKEFLRASRVIHATDSIAVDSGSFGILSQRPGGKPVDQRGLYVSTWKRVPGGDPDWVMRSDIIIPAPSPKTR